MQYNNHVYNTEPQIENSFMFSAPRLWNTLILAIRCAPTIDSFLKNVEGIFISTDNPNLFSCFYLLLRDFLLTSTSPRFRFHGFFFMAADLDFAPYHHFHHLGKGGSYRSTWIDWLIDNLHEFLILNRSMEAEMQLLHHLRSRVNLETCVCRRWSLQPGITCS